MDNMGKRILLVDDDSDLCEILQFNLNREGYYTEVARSAEEAIKRELISFDLILLDIKMGYMSGLQFAKKLRKELKLPVSLIFLTVKNSESDILAGFSAGADDYITKPFSLNELFVRIRAVLNRYPKMKFTANSKIRFGGIEFDTNLSRIIINDEYEELTRKESEILKLILVNPGRVFPREVILKKIWGNDSRVEVRTVDVHIARLRGKFGEFSYYLRNKAGIGYYLET